MRCPKKRQIPNPDPRQSAPFIRADLREPLDPGSSLLETTVWIKTKRTPFHQFKNAPPTYIGATTPLSQAGSGFQGKYI